MLPLAHRTRPLKILCIEEDAIQRKLLCACMEVIGAECLVAPRAAHGIWQFRRTPVDMVLMDIDWHAKEEIAAFEEMRRPPRWGRSVPILAVTDNDCGWSEADYCDAGFAGLYLKPVEPMRLFPTIDAVLRADRQQPLLDVPHFLHHSPVIHHVG